MKLTVIDFWADWCQPCKKLSPLLDKLAQQYSNSIDLIKVDADKEDNFEILAQYEIRSIPTLIVLLEDQHIDTLVGAQSEIALRDWLESLINEYL